MKIVPAWYLRLRHARGHGVHSPSAYAVVRGVLNPGRRYAYYSYARLRGRVCGLDRRLLMRLALWSRASAVSVVGVTPGEVADIARCVRAASPSVRIVDCACDEAQMTIDMSRCGTVVHGDSRVVICRRRCENVAALSTASRGTVFVGRRHLIYVATAGDMMAVPMSF